ncbi:30S ribosomal protein S7 [Candidatus Woesearchaeota archaeon CG10_big_fil_rev_8_21_14_0_10_34_12]|nr:MAG: 30S ribosomal protein S7 [Candidatus Woesearchaeota archaeon CG10_big_fil_rev_8_21_14_0_10_34_12]
MATAKIFDLYDVSEVKVEDHGLKRYVNFDARLVIKSFGKGKEKFGKAKVNILERIANLLTVPGHRGKKHRVITSWASGKYDQKMKILLQTLKIIEEKTKQNPIQVLVKAIENSAPKEEVTAIEYGGARYPQAVDASPYRRVTIALRNIVHGSQDKSFGKKTKIHEALANEIIFASQNSPESFACGKRNEFEKQADAAR